MKRILLLIATVAFSAIAQAGGLPYAVESFSKAQAISKEDAARHVLVFYTSEN